MIFEKVHSQAAMICNHLRHEISTDSFTHILITFSLQAKSTVCCNRSVLEQNGRLCGENNLDILIWRHCYLKFNHLVHTVLNITETIVQRVISESSKFSEVSNIITLSYLILVAVDLFHVVMIFNFIGGHDFCLL